MTINPTRSRSEVSANETWDLSMLCKDDRAWEEKLRKFIDMYPRLADFEGRLAESADVLKEFLDFYFELALMDEQIGYYAFLRLSEDQGNSDSQSRNGRYIQASAAMSAISGFVNPEIQGISEEKINSWMKQKEFSEYRIFLKKLLRFKPHILSSQEERLLAMQKESNQTPQRTFNALTDVDMEFGMIKTPEGDQPLTQGTFIIFMQNPDRDIRREAFKKFYTQLTGHQNTLASLYAGSVNQDVYRARIRNYRNSLEAALFPDKVNPEVYHNLIQTVNEHLPLLHEYYRIRRERQKISDYNLIDTRVPVVENVVMKHSYDEAAGVLAEALSPLGSEYVDTLTKGLRTSLRGAWVDKYENKGKRSGAFSAGSFTGEPYILMNYKDNVIRELFTLAHEAGHSMHSWYSSRNNPFPHYNYTIFEAEVASTFNEQLLFSYMLSHQDDQKIRTFLINKQIDDMIATIFRQTMFAEFELRCHEIVENADVLTVQSLREEYAKLLANYFGKDVEIPEEASMEGLRIPHFYRAFYVYKYATGLSAAIALSQGVLKGGKHELDNYFTFLKSGGSRFPVESLAAAGVDMSHPEPICNAMTVFGELVQMLKE